MTTPVISKAGGWTNSKWIQRKTRDLKLIGKGGFGCVFSFFDEKSQVHKALKVIEYSKILENREIKIDENEWFGEAKTEIKNLSELDGCEFILKLDEYHFDVEYNCIYLVTDIAEMNLLEYIVQSPELSVAQIENIVQSVLKGLAFAHGKGIVHRDIKPEMFL